MAGDGIELLKFLEYCFPGMTYIGRSAVFTAAHLY